MEKYQLPQFIELFHLLFLRQLQSKMDKRLYALKGGCNLRFYHKSIRYSEDIDFDVSTIAPLTLKNKIDKILASVNFNNILKTKKIEVMQYTSTKQTLTTQRWKILFRCPLTSMNIPTKIEFSRRSLDSGSSYEAIDHDIISQYNLYPILCNHYTRDTAFLQKIEALAYRTETQTRDIFDLKWLLEQNPSPPKITSLTEKTLSLAITNVTQLNFSDYKGQVVAFLMEEYKNSYSSKESWKKMVDTVLLFLENLA